MDMVLVYGFGVTFSHSKRLLFRCRKHSRFLNCPSSEKNADGKLDSKDLYMVPSLHPERTCTESYCMMTKIASVSRNEGDDFCPAERVREFKTDKKFFEILDKAKETDSLVVVDIYLTSCGSCKYIEQGFSKLCRGSGEQEAPVIFLKHKVIDEYDEQSEDAEQLCTNVNVYFW